MVSNSEPSDSRPPWARMHLWQIQWVRDLLIGTAFLGLLMLGHRLSLVTVPLLLALGLAYLLEPLMRGLEKRLHLKRRSAAALLLVGVFFCAVVPITVAGVVATMQSARVAQSVYTGSSAVVASVRAPEDLKLAEAVPPAWRRVRNTVVEIAETARAEREQPGSGEGLASAMGDDLIRIINGILEFVSTNSERLASSAIKTGGNAARLAFSTVGWLGNVAFMGFLCLFFLYFAIARQADFSRFVRELVPEKDRGRAGAVFHRMDNAVSGFIRGRITIALFLALFYILGFAVIGVPAPILLGCLISLLALVPYATLAALPVVMTLMALEGASGLRGEWWWILVAPTIWYQLGQALDDYVLTPRIQGKTTDLSTPQILFASLAGGLLGGFYGLLVAIPAAACLNILVDELLKPAFVSWVKGNREDFLPLEE